MTPAPLPASPIASPQTQSGRNQFPCTVLQNVSLCREHYGLVLGLPSFPATEPGQFVQVSCRAHAEFAERELEWSVGRAASTDALDRELSGPVAFLRRPFSLAGRRDTKTGVELDLIHRVVGVGTDWLARLRVGDVVDILGPLGNRFALPDGGAPAILVGGGVGIPPMLYLAGKLARRPAVAFCGAVSKDLLPLTLTGEASADGQPLAVIEEFSRHGIPSVISTDDGTYGFRGFVTQALEQYLDRTKHAKPPVLYTCGPEPMMKRVADIAAGRGLECQVAVERAMACGMGTCQSCCIRVRKSDASKPPLVGRDWCYRLACTDGPVFRGADLLW